MISNDHLIRNNGAKEEQNVKSKTSSEDIPIYNTYTLHIL